jgi:hypothetical protein
VEYQKIVSEWTFQKDTVDIPQVCTGLGRLGMCFGGGGLGTALMCYDYNSGRNLSIQAASCQFAVQLQQMDPPETHGGHPTAVGHPAAAAVVQTLVWGSWMRGLQVCCAILLLWVLRSVVKTSHRCAGCNTTGWGSCACVLGVDGWGVCNQALLLWWAPYRLGRASTHQAPTNTLPYAAG